ncbi:MAG: 2-amino-4-hydroxy-6-hydroxymethyldihydropteridine diphosphokinase, partial [Planctomycetes bacterium]|nr:2-amino-4-hydroxy-6-hydroxymethyldihydropteridine diphosphokinase [Planctomycetota bacterium]
MVKKIKSLSTAYVGLGSNLKDKTSNLKQAIKNINDLPAVRVTRQSRFYRTAPEGLTDQPDFLNAALEVKTSLTPRSLLKALLKLERKMGRVRTKRWGPRLIDLDLLFYDNVIMSLKKLVLPHPRLTQRRFVLRPLTEIAPRLKHP